MFILIIQIIIVYLFSCIIHEIAHSEAASYLGDNTAKFQGRSSLNPFNHFTLSGFRKVPIRLLKDIDLILVNAAGIISNLAIALFAIILCTIQEFQILNVIIIVNVLLVIINTVPIKFKNTTTDGYKILKHIKYIK